MQIRQSRSLERKVKKFTKQEKNALDKQVKRIAENPSIGTEKKGDLRGVFVHKFKIKGNQDRTPHHCGALPHHPAYKSCTKAVRDVSIPCHGPDMCSSEMPGSWVK